ncbi:hypothetical protein CR194_10895 [Salipaludibacillus keqinensis]|uniref:DUF4179 domain-containing protein n=1 Tax=Salipaludibacillus keqinensis TaxID=2045207 RepID=A0A323TJ98_9BACI|nr:DUF4179 domain-containing protein [Salipaludibacillus keqinensis]PYZ93657.1 hypothetical protein CR194_10895 [Salipaludibacillus keqinensis]
MNCETCQSLLLDYYDQNLAKRKNHQIDLHLAQCATCSEEHAELSKVINDFTLEVEAIQTPDEFIEQVQSKLPSEIVTVKPPLSLKYKVGLPVIMGCLLFILALFTSPSFYYTVLDVTSIEYDSLDRTIAEGYGEDLHLVEEQSGIQITITEVVADELATHIYYELENVEGDTNHSINAMSDINIENVEEIWSDLNKSRNSSNYYKHRVVNKNLSAKENRQRGRLELPPIDNKETEIQLTIDSLLELPDEDLVEESTDAFQDYIGETYGPWSYEIPIQRSQISEYDLSNQTVEVEGTEFTLLGLKTGPTSTHLEYRKDFDIYEPSIHMHMFTPTALYVGNERAGFSNWNQRFTHFSWEDTRDEIVVFEPILFQNINNLEVSFEFLQQNVDTSMVIDLNKEQSFPFEVDFLEGQLTIDEFTNEQDQVSIQVTDEYIEGRTHENLFIYGMSNGRRQDSFYPSSRIVVDKLGEEYPFQLIIHQWDLLDEPRHYTTEYQDLNNKSVDVDQLRIDGYVETIPLDEIFAIENIQEVQE